MKLPSSLRSLEDRVAEFMASENAAIRAVVDQIVTPLNQAGEAFVIGGLVRDIAIYGIDERPPSDIDFVVKGCPEAVDLLAKQLGAQPNRFGGYGVKNDHFRVDFWDWSRTWAKTSGHVRLRATHDICKTTFFDWDAVAFSTKTGRIFAIDRYLDRLHSKMLDINLRPNPSPLGSLVRALRRIKMLGARPSAYLTKFIYETLNDYCWDEIVNAERGAFYLTVLSDFESKEGAWSVLIDNKWHERYSAAALSSDRELLIKGLREEVRFPDSYFEIKMKNPRSFTREKRSKIHTKQMGLPFDSD